MHDTGIVSLLKLTHANLQFCSIQGTKVLRFLANLHHEGNVSLLKLIHASFYFYSC